MSIGDISRFSLLVGIRKRSSNTRGYGFQLTDHRARSHATAGKAIPSERPAISTQLSLWSESSLARVVDGSPVVVVIALNRSHQIRASTRGTLFPDPQAWSIVLSSCGGVRSKA
jgi:hypothetical protein